ncbi:MFS transporter [Knoellia aerolata]|uniref:Major facilitator superfamily (MFS) profile domain-containing protein n=1 Tax=Knoellia aerolata DSM 18566 TaxID=1385519 RepID=A0A0A0JWB7_9MICO|nr:MFS transporter [Knoellia aerolata]KGN40954.1 hypothetical protein N801_10205 [Knoellia aerolata DSM 18566]
MSTTLAPRTPLVTRPFALLGCAELAYFTAEGVAIYTLPLHVTGPLGSDTAGAGVAFGAFAVAALVLRPFAGRLCDTIGRRPLLVTGAVLAALTLALTPYAVGLAHVVALRLVLGVADAAFFVAAIAALVDLAPPDRLGEAQSYNSLGLYLGLTLGPLLGEATVRSWGFDGAWLVAAALAGLAGALVTGVGETLAPAPGPDAHAAHGPTRSGASPRGRLIHRPSVPIGLAFLTSIVAMGGFLAFAALRATEVGLANASLPVVVYGAVVVLCRLTFARLVDRVTPLLLGAAALATMAAGLLVIVTTGTATGLVVGAVVLGVGISFSTPAFFTAIFAAADPADRGAASGTATACIDLGVGIGPVVLGFVAQSAGIPTAFAISALVAGAGAAWSLVLLRRPAVPVLRQRQRQAAT